MLCYVVSIYASITAFYKVFSTIGAACFLLRALFSTGGGLLVSGIALQFSVLFIVRFLFITEYLFFVYSGNFKSKYFV